MFFDCGTAFSLISIDLIWSCTYAAQCSCNVAQFVQFSFLPSLGDLINAYNMQNVPFMYISLLKVLLFFCRLVKPQLLNCDFPQAVRLLQVGGSI